MWTNKCKILSERIEDLIESQRSSSDGLDSDAGDGLSAFADKLLKVKQDIDSLNEMIQTASNKKAMDLGNYVPTDEAVSLMLVDSGMENSKLVGMDREIRGLLSLTSEVEKCVL